MEKIDIKASRFSGRFLETYPAGSRAVLRIGIVVPVPVELRLAVPVAAARNVVRIVRVNRTESFVEIHPFHLRFRAVQGCG